jgi:hypothetical protein
VTNDRICLPFVIIQLISPLCLIVEFLSNMVDTTSEVGTTTIVYLE